MRRQDITVSTCLTIYIEIIKPDDDDDDDDDTITLLNGAEYDVPTLA